MVPMVEGIIECKNLHWFFPPPQDTWWVLKKMQCISKKGVPNGLSILFSETPLPPLLPPTNNRGNIILDKVPFDYIEK